MKPLPTEHQSQATVIMWARVNQHQLPELEMLVATPNAGKRSYGAARWMKEEGLSSGFPDLSLLVPSDKFHGLFIEMKREGGKLTEHQKDWLKKLKKWGYDVAICFSADEAIKKITNYLINK